MKLFDVHFRITLDDFFCIDANTEEEAQEIVKGWLSQLETPTIQHLNETMRMNLTQEFDERVHITEVVSIEDDGWVLKE